MLENKSYKKITIGSERNFGLVFFIFFTIISIYPLWHGENIRVWSFALAIVLFILSIFFPKILIFPNKLWFRFGLLLGNIISPVIMAIIYFLTVTPIGIIMRICGKDLLQQKINKQAKSYWIKRKEPVGSMKNQY